MAGCGTRARLVGLITVCALLALAPSAVAAVPGHYTGTTDQNYPISFDVAADGKTLTNVVTTYNAFCTPPGPATAKQRSTNSTYPFPITADTISGDDTEPAYLKLRGTFTSPTQASGTFSGFGGGFRGGTPYFCNALDRQWSASTTAAGPAGGNQGGGTDAGGGGTDAGGDVLGQAAALRAEAAELLEKAKALRDKAKTAPPAKAKKLKAKAKKLTAEAKELLEEAAALGP